ncbi:MAG: sigma-70 family RNA polymerase sigma factor [Patescibacteria group bacterium]|jgi:RNA polymerase sigma factor (sigma-70 family)
MKNRRFQHDSEGHRAEFILFSELNPPKHIKNPTPEDMLGGVFDSLPDIGFGDTSRYNTDDQQATINALRSAFTLLTVKQRGVIYKKFYQNKSIQEIAKEMGISHSATYRLLNRAVKDLKYLLLKDKEQATDDETLKSGKMVDLDEILFALKTRIHSCHYLRKKSKEEIYKLVDEIDKMVMSSKPKSENSLISG